MAHYQNQYGAVQQTTDEYGNPIRPTDETGYGTYQTGGTTMGGIGTGPTGTGVATGHHGRGHLGLHRDDSSSSSSSDDEIKGTKKKGITDKIMENIPGIGHKDHSRPHRADATTTPGGYSATGEGQYQYEHGHEKKGLMDKIKDKLPGSHGH